MMSSPRSSSPDIGTPVGEWFSLHDDVLTEVLVTIHTSGEKSLWLLLVVVEWFSLHDDVLTEVLITVHTSGEELVGSWLLIVVEWLALHNDILTKIFVTIHTSGEKSLWLLLVV